MRTARHSSSPEAIHTVMLTIDVASLDQGLHEIALDPGADELELDPETFKDVHVDARLDVSERRILVIFDATATATLECDRTLRPFDMEIGGTHHVIFAPPEFSAFVEDDYDDVRTLGAGDTKIDVTDVVRDTILLAIPQRCVAPGAEEEEIPTQFGAPDDEQDEIDPRWEALRALKSGVNTN